MYPLLKISKIPRNVWVKKKETRHSWKSLNFQYFLILVILLQRIFIKKQRSPSTSWHPNGMYMETIVLKFFFSFIVIENIWGLMFLFPQELHTQVSKDSHSQLNPLQPGVAFLHPFKISENLKVFWYFQGV